VEKKHPDAGRVILAPGHEDCKHPMPALVVSDDGTTTECGELTPLRYGQPITPGGYLVMPDESGDLRIVDIGRSGPAQVATKEYRDGWARTFDRALN
jgi:hypothetical protein